MSGTFTNITYHIVFSTKDRRRYLTNDIQSRVHAYLGGIVKGEGGIPYFINGTEDHVHLLIRWHTRDSLANLMRKLKAESSRWIHNEFSDCKDFAWQRGYAAFSVSHSQHQKVGDYIQNQAEHHKSRDFKEELIQLLKAHDIDYDERYIWE